MSRPQPRSHPVSYLWPAFWDLAVDTGFVVTGLTVLWRVAFRWLTHDEATADESLGERREPLRKVA